jgi:sigma-B regulation protein RsbU (phosphoserine phosphatase)
VLRSGRHDPVHYRELWDTLLAGRVFRGTMVNRRRDGQTYYAEMTITPIRGPSGAVTHFVAVGKDMTDRRARQEQALEMGVARAVQRRLFPSGPPSLPGFDIAAVAMPAAATCGDYYDFIHVGAGRLAVAIADVSGHGLGPALVMSQTRAYLRAYLHTLADPGEVLRQLNLTLIGDLEPGRFVTMLLARLDPRDRSLVFANAGHPPGLVLRADGELRATLDSRGTPLGVWPARSVAGAEPVTLEPGDTVVLVTDGITESQAPDGRLFGTEGVLAAVRAHLGGSARDVRDGLIADARAFAAGGAPTDDLTAIVCKVAPDR